MNLPGRHKEDDVNLVVAHAVRTRSGENGSPERGDLDLVVASAVRASDGHHGHSSPRGDGADNLIAFDDRNQAVSVDTYHTLNGEAGMRSDAIAFHSKDYGQDAAYDISSTVRAAENENGGTPPAIAYSAGVRRLTPLECERLMGWPDEHTRYAADGKEIPDSHRYRLCGNGVVATVAEWIGHRLVRSNCGYA